MPAEPQSKIPDAGTVVSRDEWRLWKLTENPRTGQVHEVFEARGSRDYVLGQFEERKDWGIWPARWRLQPVYVCEVFGEAEELLPENFPSKG